MANKTAPDRSPRPPARPRPEAPARSPAPRARDSGTRGQFLRGMNRHAAEEAPLAPPRRLNSGGVCRGTGAAARGGQHGKLG